MSSKTWTDCLPIISKIGIVAVVVGPLVGGCVASHDGDPPPVDGKVDFYGGCDADACGAPLAVAPRRCADGTLVGPDIACDEDESGVCRWEIVRPAMCPEDLGDGGVTGCTPDVCGPPPELSPRRCDDGTLVGPTVECREQPSPDMMTTTCGWEITEEAVCPEDAACRAEDCAGRFGPRPRLCDDGSTAIGIEIECRAEPSGVCDWAVIDDGVCPEDAACAIEDCGAPPPTPLRFCDDGTVIEPTLTCEPQASGMCGWTVDFEPCPEDP